MIMEKNPYQFFFPAFQGYKGAIFHFRLGTIPRRKGTGNSKAVTSVQERSRFLYFSVVSLGVFNNPVHIFVPQFSFSAHEKQQRNTEIARPAFLY